MLMPASYGANRAVAQLSVTHSVQHQGFGNFLQYHVTLIVIFRFLKKSELLLWEVRKDQIGVSQSQQHVSKAIR